MIYITGDVHTKIRNNFEQESDGSEVEAAIKFLEILRKYRLSSTLFINGRCFEREKEKVKKLLDFDVELGGHTYDNFGGEGLIKNYIYRKIWKCIYGPDFYQKKDIKRTKKVFEKTGLKMISWRTHAFGSNDKTFKLLSKEGVKYVSDLTGDIKPFFKEGIIHMPINIPVDQNTIAYGILKPENRAPFIGAVKGRIKAEEWFEILKKRVMENEKNKKGSIILIHPITMSVLDKFELFEKIAKFLSKYKSRKILEFNLGA